MNEKEPYYFPEHLKKQLSKIPHYRLTVVEAPSGFGKTTAIREYLKNYLPHGAHNYWHTCLGLPTTKMWNGICNLFEHIDSESAGQLREMELPSKDALADIAALLQKLCCDFETYLIIDNYQLFGNAVPEELLTAFATQGSDPKLHMIFITQQLSSQLQTELRHSSAHIVSASDFFFDRNSTARLFKLAGIRLTDAELDSVHSSTEGWISALRLQMVNYQKSGCFEYNTGIEQLVETAIWNKLLPAEKDFLLKVCVLDSFTVRQAKRMLNENCLPESIESLLSTNVMLRYYAENDAYILHSIMQSYVRKRFYRHQTENYQRQVLSRAGLACLDESDYNSAARFFSEAGDFDAFLSFPLRSDYLSSTSDWDLIGIIERTVRACPPDILGRYPESALILSFQLFLFSRYELSAYLCEIVRMALENPVGMKAGEVRRLQGEMEYLLSFSEYNDVEKMSARNKTAYELLEGPSRYRFALGNFGSVSIVYMYWRKSGELEQAVAFMEKNLPLYRLLSGGHSTGSDSAMRAEWLLLRGDTDAAENLCYRAIYAAQSDRQTGICLCAKLVMARIALLRGDAEGYCTTVEHIRQYADMKHGRYTERAAQLCLGSLALTLGETQELANWLNNLDAIEKNLYPATVPYGQMLYGKLLLLEQRYSELYGISQPVLELAQEKNYLLPQIYLKIYLAVAALSGGQQVQAQSLLNEALEMALPDQVYLPFAEHGALLPLLEAARDSGFDCQKIDHIISLCARQQAGIQVVHKSIRMVKSSLTPRERDVALLARDRLSTREIADRLLISENTVKSVLKIVYQKLEVASKGQLADKIF